FLNKDIDRSHAGLCSFARICVEVDLSKGLPNRINLKFGNFLHSQPLDYENTAFRCRNCRNPGHLQASCPEIKKPVKKGGLRVTKGWGSLDLELVEVATFKAEPCNVNEEKKVEESVESGKTENDQGLQGMLAVSGTKRGLSPAKSNSDQESLSDNRLVSENPLQLAITDGNGKWQKVTNKNNKKGRISSIEDYFSTQVGH
ncbi:hypothetical protein KI387_020370, partial [Taxus chinensis]